MAAKYRKIDPRMWDDEKFAELLPREKLIAVYVLTAQSNRCGIFRFSVALAAEQTGIDAETFGKGFRKVCEAFGWGFDERRKVIYLPTWWKYNPPENQNVLKGCMSDLHDVPQTELMKDFSVNLKYLPANLHETFRKPLAIQEQEQEQEQEQNNTPPTPPRGGSPSRRFTKPTLEEVRAYCLERGNHVDPEQFVAHYEANGWKVGRNPMHDWRAAVRTWEKNDRQRASVNGHATGPPGGKRRLSREEFQAKVRESLDDT